MPKMPKKIQNLFLKRAQIPYDCNTGLQIRDFFLKSLEIGDFQEPKTDIKQMNCYQKDLTSKPLSNYYVFLRDLNLKCLALTNFAHNKLKAVTMIYFICKYLEKCIVVG